MSRGGDEVQTAVDPAVGHLASVDPGLRVQVVLKLAVYVVDDRLPAEEQTGVVSREQQTWGGPSRCAGGGGRPGLSHPHQLLLSTASPKPGVSTMVSSSWTLPSFTRTLDCST